MPLDLPSSGHRPADRAARPLRALPPVPATPALPLPSIYAQYAEHELATALPVTPVAIVSADPLVDAGLRAQLAVAPELRLVDDPADAAIIVWAPPPLHPGELPNLPIDAAAHEAGEPPPVVAIIPDTTDPMPLLAAGVRGLLGVDLDVARLRAAIFATQLGLSVLDEDPADAIVAAWSPPHEPASTSDRLTPREREVLELLAEGLSNREIGAALGISAHTIKFHVDALLDKLSARSRTQAVVKAMREGLLAL